MDTAANIILIGMPGVGKSTVGVLLAKDTGKGFLDTDVWIQACTGRTLQDMLDADGLEAFCQMEQRHICALAVTGCVVATGGSAVYSDAAMRHLGATGPVVYLGLALEPLQRRITNLATRGVVIARGRTLEDLYYERRPLYERWADLTIDCGDRTQDELAAEIARELADGGVRRA